MDSTSPDDTPGTTAGRAQATSANENRSRGRVTVGEDRNAAPRQNR